MVKEKKTNMHAGHRARMKEKLASYGPRIFHTYELLEMLLYYAVPYKDTNPIAKRLLQRFSSLDGVLVASKEEIKDVEGIGEKAAELVFCLGKAGFDFCLKKKDAFCHTSHVLSLESLKNDGGLKNKPSYPKASPNDLEEYVKNSFDTTDAYEVKIFFFDGGMCPISVKEFKGVDYGSGAISCAKIVSVAKECGAKSVIAAHTHPYGPLFASEADLQTNKLLQEALLEEDIILCEHFVLSGKEIRSLMNFSFSLACNEESETREDTFDTNKVMFSLLRYTRKDPALTIKVLLEKYGSWFRAFEADTDSLAKTLGDDYKTAGFIKLILAIVRRRRTDAFKFGKRHSNGEILEYLASELFALENECVYLVTLDETGRVLSCDFSGEGDENYSNVFPSKMLSITKKHGSKSVILAHNHPGGSLIASEDDVISTRHLGQLFRQNGITLLKHYVFADFECREISI